MTLPQNQFILRHLHWMQFCIRWLALRQFNCCDTQTPDVSLVIVSTLFDHLWRHPVWCPNKGVFLG